MDPSAILALLPSLLPEQGKILGTPHDALAALVHTAFVSLDFRLIGLEESANLPANSNVLPEDWNKFGPGNYCFKYKHHQSSLEFIVKFSKLGTRTVINALALESENVATWDILTEDFTSQSFYPYRFAETNDQPLVHGFISSNRVSDLFSRLKLKIVQKLIPGLQKEGYTEELEPVSSSSADSATDTRNSRQRPELPPADPPDPRGSYIYPPLFPRNPLEIGRSDLDPLPRNPFSPPSLFPPGSGDGMFVGPDHPIFGGANNSRNRVWGGDGYLPPIGAPPGARFDPIVPGVPPRRPQDPDNDEFMPPGMGDMFM